MSSDGQPGSGNSSRVPEPGEVPPRRRLERAPSERYRSAAPSGPGAPPPGGEPGSGTPASALGAASGMVGGIAVSGLGALAIVLVYGVMATTLGLLAISGTTGFLVGLALRVGAIRSGVRSSLGRRAALVAVVGIGLGIVGGWLVSLGQGGVAGLGDYVSQTLGLEALILPLAAVFGAWLGTR